MLVYISSGNGVDEVCRALWHFERWIEERFEYELVDSEQSSTPRAYRSLLLRSDDSRLIALRGTLLWSCTSPFRPKHKRKNWYFSLECYEEQSDSAIESEKVIYQTMKSPKKGGQHVNTTSSGVRAIYPPLGLEALSYDERSQHQNKKIAYKRLLHKASLLAQSKNSQSQQRRWREGKAIERGNPVRVFVGSGFEEKIVSKFGD